MKKLSALLIILIAFNLCNGSSYKHSSTLSNYISEILTSSFAVLNDQSLKRDEKVKILKNKMLDNLDVNWMSNFVLGRWARTLSLEQKDKFNKVYANYITSFYASGVKLYSGQDVRVADIVEEGDIFLVKTFVLKKGGENSISVNYVIKMKEEGFKILDVITDNVSLISSQRSEFNTVIFQKGFDNLIKDLRSKT